MDPDRQIGNGHFPARGFLLLLHAVLCVRNQSIAPSVPPHHTGIPPANPRAALHRVVLLHAPLLRDAVALGVLRDGHALLPARRRDRRSHLQSVFSLEQHWHLVEVHGIP